MDITKPKATPKEVADVIKLHQKIFIVSHEKPDADAIGSSLGLALGLESLGKEVWVANKSELGQENQFLPSISKIKNDLPNFTPEIIIVCDCGAIERVGKEWQQEIENFKPLVNIDHHAPNPGFGTVNYIDPGAVSTSSMVYMILKELEVVLTKEIASCLYAGVAGDTGIFRWMHPKPEDFRDAAEFVAAGADPVLIATELYGRVTAEAINLKAEALSNLEYYLDKQVVFVTVTDEMCARHNANSKDGKDLVSMLRYIDGVLCSVYMRKEDNKWNVSFRSDANKLNVAEVASELGGGGHPAAAAFRRSGVEAEDLKKEIISIIKSKLKK